MAGNLWRGSCLVMTSSRIEFACLIPQIQIIEFTKQSNVIYHVTSTSAWNAILINLNNEPVIS